MNGQTVPIHTNLLVELADSLKTKGVASLRKKLLLALPDDTFRYGSELWWEQSELKATEDIKRGNVIRLHDAKEMIAYLHKRVAK